MQLRLCSADLSDDNSLLCLVNLNTCSNRQVLTEAEETITPAGSLTSAQARPHIHFVHNRADFSLPAVYASSSPAKTHQHQMQINRPQKINKSIKMMQKILRFMFRKLHSHNWGRRNNGLWFLCTLGCLFCTWQFLSALAGLIITKLVALGIWRCFHLREKHLQFFFFSFPDYLHAHTSAFLRQLCL